jgi:predicted nucleotidyltransferase
VKTLSRELREEITRRLVAELQPEQIILFGSHAWGTPHEDSDVDLLVVMPDDAEPVAETDYRARAALCDLGISKDILVRTRAQLQWYGRVPASLERAILDRGVVLYR